MAKKKHEMSEPLPLTEEEAASLKRRAKRSYLIVTVLNTIAVYALYVILITAFPPYSKVIVSVYLIALAAFSFGYVIYNRGFSRKNITVEMLPDTMSEEEKTEYVADAKHRLDRSKWCLTILIPLIFTFFMDIFILFIYEPYFAPYLGNLF